MKISHFTCVECGAYISPRSGGLLCKCGGSLDIVYKPSKYITWEFLRKQPFSHWRYRELLPELKKQISLGEGGTPVVKSVKENLWFKLESTNPTGSFKDRGSSVEVSVALKKKAKKVVCASTGNMGASVAAYCARSGLPCEIVLPKDASGEKVKQIKQLGAKIIQIKGDYTVAERVAWKQHDALNEYLVGDYAFRGEGEKTVALELADQMNLPKYVVVPMGNGTLISGMWKAFVEMKTFNLIKRLPTLIGVQAKGCSPICSTFEKEPKKFKPVRPKTKAGAIACGNPRDRVKAIRALKQSKGKCITVTDKEILKARSVLAKNEGIDCEPSAAATYAAVKKLKLSNAVLIITGHGLKDLKNL